MEKTIKRAKKLLLALGIAPNLKGYRYLTVAISKLYASRKAHKEVSYCKLYEEVAQECGTTDKRAERSIRSAIINTLAHNKKLWENTLNYKISDGLKVSEFLSLCVEKLILNE